MKHSSHRFWDGDIQVGYQKKFFHSLGSQALGVGCPRRWCSHHPWGAQEELGDALWGSGVDSWAGRSCRSLPALTIQRFRNSTPCEWSIRAPPALTQSWQSRLAPLPEVRGCVGTLPALPPTAAPRYDVTAPQWRGAAAAGRGQQRPADGGGPEPRGVTAKRGWRHHRPGDRDRHRAPHGGTGGSACAALRAQKHRFWLST